VQREAVSPNRQKTLKKQRFINNNRYLDTVIGFGYNLIDYIRRVLAQDCVKEDISGL